MMKKKIQKMLFYMTVMLVAVICLTGCGPENKGGDTQTEEDSQMDMVQNESLFLIVANDTMEESLTLYSLETGLESYYEYSFMTQFRDKYGNYTSVTEFTPGRVVTIGKTDRDGYLTELQLSDQVWEYEKVRRFSVDEDKGILTIADTKYSIQDKVYVLSNGERITFSDLSEEDILTVVGMDKKIVSIVVTTGHGTLSLKNTELFEDSFLQLDYDIFAIITKNMEIDVPEGVYILKVANDGWGGTTEIVITRGETTVVDLDTLKGEGKQKGMISFQIDVEDVKVYVDYELIDHTQPIELTYGTHVLEIEASGYDAWKKHLYVNSEEATIVVELTEGEEDSEEESEEESESEEEESESEEASQEESETESTN